MLHAYLHIMSHENKKKYIWVHTYTHTCMYKYVNVCVGCTCNDNMHGNYSEQTKQVSNISDYSQSTPWNKIIIVPNHSPIIK